MEKIEKKWIVEISEKQFTPYDTEEEAKQDYHVLDAEPDKPILPRQESLLSFCCNGCGEELEFFEGCTITFESARGSAEEDLRESGVRIYEDIHICEECHEEGKELELLDDKNDELDAVMHSVDKWLSKDWLKENPATRAAAAREIALMAIEKAEMKLVKLVNRITNINERNLIDEVNYKEEVISFITAEQIITIIRRVLND